jgi:hypothetical protein
MLSLYDRATMEAGLAQPPAEGMTQSQFRSSAASAEAQPPRLTNFDRPSCTPMLSSP